MILYRYQHCPKGNCFCVVIHMGSVMILAYRSFIAPSVDLQCKGSSVLHLYSCIGLQFAYGTGYDNVSSIQV